MTGQLAQRQPHPPGTGGATQLTWTSQGLRDAAETELTPQLRGPIFLPGDIGYDDERRGHNLAMEHRPAVIVGATGAADVMAAVAFATKHELAVCVLNTGHSASVPAAGVLINTRRMRGVRVDPFARRARIESGVRWEQVVHEAAAFGLAPLCGSSSGVGVVGYTLGGGLGVLARSFGYAADHVRSIDIVTAHGMLRQATPHQYSDLFWALRGGKGNFGVVTSMEIDLFPEPRLYGGGLYFRGTAAPDVLTAYRRWVRTVPEEMTSSVALVRFPLLPEVPESVRGRFVVHVRIAYRGPPGFGEAMIKPLRDAALTLRDTVADIPFAAVEAVHDDPSEPFALHEGTTYLRDIDEDAVDALLHMAGPDSTCPLRLVELRHLGGAAGREPEVPNAVGHRDAGFLLYLAGAANPDDDSVPRFTQEVLDRMAPWSTGGVALNFLGAHDATPERVYAAYSPGDYRRLVRIKRAYDPDNIFRSNHNIPPGATFTS